MTISILNAKLRYFSFPLFLPPLLTRVVWCCRNGQLRSHLFFRFYLKFRQEDDAKDLPPPLVSTPIAKQLSLVAAKPPHKKEATSSSLKASERLSAPLTVALLAPFSNVQNKGGLVCDFEPKKKKKNNERSNC
jgi:hypothetical protein